MREADIVGGPTVAREAEEWLFVVFFIWRCNAVVFLPSLYYFMFPVSVHLCILFIDKGGNHCMQGGLPPTVAHLKRSACSGVLKA